MCAATAKSAAIFPWAAMEHVLMFSGRPGVIISPSAAATKASCSTMSTIPIFDNVSTKPTRSFFAYNANFTIKLSADNWKLPNRHTLLPRRHRRRLRDSSASTAKRVDASAYGLGEGRTRQLLGNSAFSWAATTSATWRVSAYLFLRPNHPARARIAPLDEQSRNQPTSSNGRRRPFPRRSAAAGVVCSNCADEALIGPQYVTRPSGNGKDEYQRSSGSRNEQGGNGSLEQICSLNT